MYNCIDRIFLIFLNAIFFQLIKKIVKVKEMISITSQFFSINLQTQARLLTNIQIIDTYVNC